MIEIHDLTKTYGNRIAIDRLTFNVKKGEVVGFLGPNGAGKTTTMKIITGFMAPSSGAVKIAGFDVFEQPIEVKKRIGYLPETPPLYGDMIVSDYLSFVARLKGVEKAQIKSAVNESLEKTLLTEVKGRMIQNLSKGFRQRVGIAQALVARPEILILDEPTVGLDPRQVAEIRQLLIQLRGHHTIILSTHILPEVEATCQRVIIIDKGRIVAENTLAGLAGEESMAHVRRRIQIRVRRKASELLPSLKNIDAIKNVLLTQDKFEIELVGGDDAVEKITQVVVSSGAGLVELTEATKGLESAFIQLTSKEKVE
ncbi:MAG: ABC transporter ATP-binding protein [Bdellovibrionota bacterium]